MNFDIIMLIMSRKGKIMPIRIIPTFILLDKLFNQSLTLIFRKSLIRLISHMFLQIRDQIA